MLTGKTTVVGVGNALLSDEGAGVHTVRFLAHCGVGLADVELIDAGTTGFALAADIEEADALVVIDAAELGAPAGTVRLFEGEAMDAFLGARRRLSAHELSLCEVLSLARLTNSLPPRRALIGIQPQTLDWGERPSARVAAAIPQAAATTLALIRRWRA